MTYEEWLAQVPDSLKNDPLKLSGIASLCATRSLPFWSSPLNSVLLGGASSSPAYSSNF
jgi:hypothetical protein